MKNLKLQGGLGEGSDITQESGYVRTHDFYALYVADSFCYQRAIFFQMKSFKISFSIFELQIANMFISIRLNEFTVCRFW